MTDELVVVMMPTLLHWGTEQQTLALARVLVESGRQVRLCCYHEYDEAMAENFRRGGCAVTLLGLRREAGLRALFARLRSLLREWRPGAVHVQYVAPGFVPVLAARAAGVRRVFATVHQPGGRFGWRQKALLRAACGLTTRFFCVSRAVEASWFGSSRVFDPANPGAAGRHATIYNAVAGEEIARRVERAEREKIRASLDIDRDDRVIGVVGRLREEKGQALAIAALPAILALVPEALLLIVGDGTDEDFLRAEAGRRGVTQRVRWAGGRTHDEVVELYAATELVMVPSQYEGFGLVSAEAMAAGRPVVAAAVGGLVEVVQDGVTGILVDGAAAEGYVAPIVRLLRDGDLARRMGRAGRERVQREFSPARYREAVLAAYA